MHVTLFFDAEHDLFACVKLFTSLHLLAQTGEIRLRVQSGLGGGQAVRLTVSRPDGPKRRLAFDLSDHSSISDESALAWCDCYLKRSLHRPDLARLAEAARAKVAPLGLIWRCATTPAAKVYFLRLFARFALAAPRLWVREWRWMPARLRAFAVTPPVAFFEQTPQTPVRPVVLFQTRLWSADDAPGDHDAVNHQRVSLIRFLRRRLGPRFIGGAIPTRFAVANFPDVALSRGFRRRDYIRRCKSSLVGVYTRGLYNSHAQKLPEYLAAASCVVSDSLRNELPEPLRAGTHYLQFTSEEECLDQCERLLREPDRAYAMRQENRAYYDRQVAPATHMRRCLQRAFA